VSGYTHRPTLVENDDGYLIGVNAEGGRVHVDWHGPPHAELTIEATHTLGYLLRGYARMGVHSRVDDRDDVATLLKQLRSGYVGHKPRSSPHRPADQAPAGTGVSPHPPQPGWSHPTREWTLVQLVGALCGGSLYAWLTSYRQSALRARCSRNSWRGSMPGSNAAR
jgi:hypothetical protein